MTHTHEMTWPQLLLAQRLGASSKEPQLEPGRTPFHKDHDRIIFSSSFRRLDRKTQVHPLSENDHVHNRLTHSLEVGCVGRSLGTRAGHRIRHLLPKHIDPSDIGAMVQAACLAHDIGNPPFGHAGEDAIRHWFTEPSQAHFLEGLNEQERLDLQTFEGNAQGFRLITQVEYRRFQGGMRLSYATLGAFLKYPWSVDKIDGQTRKKFGCYQSELPILRDVAEHLGLIEQAPNLWCRHPLVYLLEAADDICYCLIDLEDGIEMDLLNYDEVEALMKPVLDHDWHNLETILNDADTTRRRLQMLRGMVMDVMIDSAVNAFEAQLPNLMRGNNIGELMKHGDARVFEVINNAKALARERIFKHPRKLSIEIGAYATLGTLLDVFLSAVKECVQDNTANYKNKRILDLMGRSAPTPDWGLYEGYLRAIDFIAGMTDNYATDLAKQLQGYQMPARSGFVS